MARELMRHRVGRGVDVLLNVAGKPITLTFLESPTDSQLVAAITVVEQQIAAEKQSAEIAENVSEVTA